MLCSVGASLTRLESLYYFFGGGGGGGAGRCGLTVYPFVDVGLNFGFLLLDSGTEALGGVEDC